MYFFVAILESMNQKEFTEAMCEFNHYCVNEFNQLKSKRNEYVKGVKKKKSKKAREQKAQIIFMDFSVFYFTIQKLQHKIVDDLDDKPITGQEPTIENLKTVVETSATKILNYCLDLDTPPKCWKDYHGNDVGKLAYKIGEDCKKFRHLYDRYIEFKNAESDDDDDPAYYSDDTHNYFNLPDFSNRDDGMVRLSCLRLVRLLRIMGLDDNDNISEFWKERRADLMLDYIKKLYRGLQLDWFHWTYRYKRLAMRLKNNENFTYENYMDKIAIGEEITGVKDDIYVCNYHTIFGMPNPLPNGFAD